MRARIRGATVAGVLAVSLVVPATSAGAVDQGHGKPPHGQKQRVMQLVRDYFVARDKGWLGSQGADAAVTRLADGQADEQPLKAASDLARIADEVAAERGLRAREVHTGVAAGPHVQIRGRKATVSATAGTFLAWNDEALGNSTLSDRYEVELERVEKTWHIVHVAYAPIPSTEATSPSATGPRPMVPAPSKAAAQAAASGTYNRQRAAEYARVWSRSGTLAGTEWLVGDQYNPDYDQFGNDCTNFASQMLHDGGWSKADGIDNENPDNWTDDLWGPRGPSKTWSVASWLYDYAGNPKRGEKWAVGSPADAEDIWQLQPGDLLFVDWDPNGRPDGSIDHTMLISGTYTELGFTEPTYSQHTPHRNNIPLSIGIKIATADPPTENPDGPMSGQGRRLVFYPVHIKDTFQTG
ncbi:amidase domain-containing protein [Streptomyces sp. NPDC006733]|uniref:amidase domain-containing protein n=1 Tax=Streptomyces sp. NPDC006733 TaxID=3155460 RepID=UPI003408C0CD